jgi:hypothetical protein
MFKRISVLTFVFVLSFSCFGQTFRFSYEPGFGYYDLGRVKGFQSQYQRNYYRFPIKAVEKFPNYLNHSASIGYYLDNNTVFGMNVTYMTTGGRNSSKDYSGEYQMDMLLNAYQIGIESESIYNLTQKFDFYINFKLGLIHSIFDVTESIDIYGLDSQSSSDQLTENSYFMEPNLGFSYNLTKRLEAKVGLGLNWDTGRVDGKLMYWSGLRTRIGISYSL